MEQMDGTFDATNGSFGASGGVLGDRLRLAGLWPSLLVLARRA